MSAQNCLRNEYNYWRMLQGRRACVSSSELDIAELLTRVIFHFPFPLEMDTSDAKE